MNRGKRSLICVFLACAVLSVAAGEVVEEIVAIINDDIITLSEYKEQLDSLEQMLKAQVQGEEFTKQFNAMKAELLDSMITDLLLMQLAKERGISVGEQVRMAVENIKRENNLESDDDLRRGLEQQGISFEMFLKQLEENFLKQSVVYGEVDRAIAIDDTEVVGYYKLHPEEFTESPEYRLRGIYLSPGRGSDEEIEAIRKEITGKLSSGEDLAGLSGQYSDGPMKENGGDFGTFKKGELDKTLEEAAEKLKVGGTSDWLRTKNGWYLIRLEDKKESRLKPFDEVKKEVEERLFVRAKQKKLGEFIKSLKDKSYIKILNPNPVG